MPQFSTKRRVRHSAADMFDLVADVEHYPEFVPLCRALRVRKRTTDGEQGHHRRRHDGRLQADPRDLHQPRDARPRQAEILVEYLEGPFQPDEQPLDFRPVGETPARSSFSSPTNSAAARSAS